MTVAVATLVSVLLACIGGLVALSPGRLAPLSDEAGREIDGSVSEKIFVDINGTQQGMFIQSADPTHPVLLFLHGGMPSFFLNSAYPTGLEKDFTVVWWEQRGAGMSFDASAPVSDLTVKQLISDTIAVTDYLRARFKQDKIYLPGHSWGSFLGIQVAAAAPERFHAYIGMAQLSDQLKSEVLARTHMIEAYRARGDLKMVERLEAAPASMSDGLSGAYMGLRDEAMHGLGVGTTRDMKSVVTGVFFPVWQSPIYTLREKINFWRGKILFNKTLWKVVVATDLSMRVTDLDLPIYFWAGRHDFTTNYDLTQNYFAKIKAPLKGFYTFENSAHSPLFEEPQRAREIMMTDLLNKTNRFAN